ncbi:MAG: 2TM domain-containing protein [Symploca sp. SIO1A3]|nr:2TM domain-containing protein [Symploca sp. SIO1A3]
MSVLGNKTPSFYRQEDIQQILNLAIARQADQGELSREQLVEIATELGISPENVLQAEQEWIVRQEEQQKRRKFNLYRTLQLKKSFGKFIIINAFLIVINLLSAGQLSWSLYILLLWGMGLGVKVWNNYQLQGEEYEQAFSKWYRKQQITEVANSIYLRVNNWIKGLENNRW